MITEAEKSVLMNKFLAAIIGLMVFMFGFCVGINCAVKVERQKAIDAGVGRWEQVDDGPDTEFVYEVPESPPD